MFCLLVSWKIKIKKKKKKKKKNAYKTDQWQLWHFVQLLREVATLT